ncbi:MAG: zinc ABC transporter substrate-binding protein [Longicatena sp.]
MKKMQVLICCVLVITSLTSCSIIKKAIRSSSKLPVYTSFYPMYDFATKIGGSKVQVTDITASTIEPHSYKPESEIIPKLQKSSLFVYNSAISEPWVATVLKDIDQKKVVVNEASKDLLTLHANGQSDPHIWMSIKQAKKELLYIHNAFVKMDEINEKYYNSRYDKYAKEFDKLEMQFKNELAPYKDKTIIVYHDAYQYLCQDYGLHAIAIEGANSDKIETTIAFMQKNNIHTVFYDNFSKASDVATITSRTGAKAVRLNTLEGRTKKEKEDKKGYGTLMKENLNKLVASFN